MIPDGMLPSAMVEGETKIRRRLVLFVHGFDPRAEKLPYAIFKREFAKHRAISGADGTLGPIEASPPGKPWLKRWRLTRADGDGEVETVFDFLKWQDLIPRRKPFRAVRMVGAGIVTFFAMLRNRIFPRMAGYAKRHVALGIFPYAMLAVYLLFMAWLVNAGYYFLSPYGPPFAALGLVLGALAAAGFYWWTVRVDTILFVWFAIALWNFQWRHGGRGIPAVEERFERFADHALEMLRDPAYDEVLLVAVSTAGYYAIEMLGSMLQRDPKLAGRQVPFLTLGAQPSVTSWFGPRRRFVEALTAVLASPAVRWIAYNIRGDIMSVAGYDPVRDNGLDPAVLNPERFVRHQIDLRHMLKPESMQALRWRFLWLHLHYLMATETGAEHDFYAITTSSTPALRAAAAWRRRALESRKAAG
jgi:hypothetical protein